MFLLFTILHRHFIYVLNAFQSETAIFSYKKLEHWTLHKYAFYSTSLV